MASNYGPGSRIPTMQIEDEYDSDSSESTPRNSRSYTPSPAPGFLAYTGPSSEPGISNYLLPSLSRVDHFPRRPDTPSACSSSSASDTEDEPASPLLRLTRQRRPPTWWQPARRRRKTTFQFLRPVRKCLRRVVRHPLFPRQPLSIVLSLISFAVFAVLLTLFLMYILNPDKQPLPWRAYCTVPPASIPPDYVLSPPSSSFYVPEDASAWAHPSFPPPDFDSLTPAGVLIGIFSMDSSVERRMLVRTSYASHIRSRNGAGDGDGGQGTSRTILRFVMGQPRKDWERRIKLEQELYNDLIILPIQENMNAGKSHSFFSWAAVHAWVPPVYESASSTPLFSYSHESNPPPPLAPHDPIQARDDARFRSPRPWVRPDFIVKVDDDSFIMLAELEGRLRQELHLRPINATSSVVRPGETDDPLIYWGYLVSNRLHRFMAGELYALSWRLVTWIANDPLVKTMINGAEDKQTSRWMRLHPRATEIRWTSERCWIYDHPRAGSVYAHGFLFPSERSRAHKTIMEYPERTILDKYPGSLFSLTGNEYPSPAAWASSTVSTFKTRYEPPIPELSTRHSVEAMVEGSSMSKLRTGAPTTPEYAWSRREGRRSQYENNRLGGTVAVHYIKKHMWFLETAMSLLDGEEFTEAEKLSMRDNDNGQGEHFSDPPPPPPPASSEEDRTVVSPSIAHRTVIKKKRKVV